MFTPLRSWFTPEPAAQTDDEECLIVNDSPRNDDEGEAIEALLGDVRRVRAALADAVQAALADLLTDIAADVLGRELELQACDLDAIVGRALERYGDATLVHVRVHPDDASAIDQYPLRPDPSLRRGDAIIEVHSGTIDARLGVRLDRVLQRR